NPNKTAPAPSPRCGTSAPPNHKPAPQKTAPRSARHDPNTHALLRSPICKAPQQPQLQPAPNNRPIHKRGSSTQAGQLELSRQNNRLDCNDTRSTRRYTQLGRTHLSAELLGRIYDAGSRGSIHMAPRRVSPFATLVALYPSGN